MWTRVVTALVAQNRYGSILGFFLLSSICFINRILMTVEGWIFPGIAKISLDDNVIFVIGHQRSGTTSIQTALSEGDNVIESTNFDCICPSLILKVLLAPSAIIINFIVMKLFDTPNHRVGLNEPLEEHLWLLHHFFGEALPSVMFPSLSQDEKILEASIAVEDWHFDFVKDCMRRVIYFKQMKEMMMRMVAQSPRREKTKMVYVGKPLLFTLHMDALRRNFPKAKLVLCIRNPSSTLPSYIDFISAITSVPPDDKVFRDRFMSLFKVYSVPLLRRLAMEVTAASAASGKQSSDASGKMLLRFSEWKKEPHKAMKRMCDWTGIVEGKTAKTVAGTLPDDKKASPLSSSSQDLRFKKKEKHKNRKASFELISENKMREYLGKAFDILQKYDENGTVPQ